VQEIIEVCSAHRFWSDIEFLSVDVRTIDVEEQKSFHIQQLIDALQGYPKLRFASVCIRRADDEPSLDLLSPRPVYQYQIRVDPVKEETAVDDVRYHDWRRSTYSGA
jgi:hypothetical protein